MYLLYDLQDINIYSQMKYKKIYGSCLINADKKLYKNIYQQRHWFNNNGCLYMPSVLYHRKGIRSK